MSPLVLMVGVMRFQSTLPVWGATRHVGISQENYSFQSTLPVWGATAAVGKDRRIGKISIHAPRVGSDYYLMHQ